MAAHAHALSSAPRSLRPGLRFPGSADTMDDVRLRELITRCKAGDEAARATLVDGFYPAVRDAVHRELALDLRRGRSWLAAQFSTGDIVQEVFLGALRDLDGFHSDDENAFKSFITTMVRHRLLDALRYHEAGRRDAKRAGRGLNVSVLGPVSDATSPTAAAARSEEVTAVNKALESLQPRDRALIEQRFVANKTYAEIAEALGIVSEGAARKAVAASQARLLIQLRRNERQP